MSTRKDMIWRDEKMAEQYLDDIAGAIPLEREQFDIMRRVIKHAVPEAKTFLDIGCGNGVVSSALLYDFPDAEGMLVDFSKTMLAAAEDKLVPYANQLTYREADYGDEAWLERINKDNERTFDIIVSRFSIHHQPDDRKYALYDEIYELLAAGGIFLNIEHVAAQTAWAEPLFENYMIDHQYAMELSRKSGKSRTDVAEAFRKRHDNDANVVAPVEEQCTWLRQIGYVDVDCYFKVLEIALFGGRKYEEENS